MPDSRQPEALRERHRLPLVWIVPIVAILAAAWLAWGALAERGPLIAVLLQDGDGLEPGKTKVQHKQVQLGLVEDLIPSPDLSHVTIHVRMNRYAEGHLSAGTKFWVVRPRLSAEGISGLGTLISGAYIEMEPGSGPPARQFTALEEPPVVRSDVPGTEFVLHAPQLGSISQGTAVSYRGLSVGNVLGTALSDHDGSATLRVFVRAPHDQLVHEGTRFWNSSGVAVELGSDGLRVQTESLESILSGGIAFDIPPGGDVGPVAKPDTSFELYSDQSAARDALYIRNVRFMMHLPGSAQGLSAGAAVRMRGIKVGEVLDVHMEYDDATGQISIPVTLQLQPQRVLLRGLVSQPGFEQRSYAVFRRFVERGLRARLASGNILTGQKIISLDFVPGAQPASLIEGGPVPEIPVIESDDLDSIMQSAKALLSGLQSTVASLNGLLLSPELKKSLRSLQETLANTERLTRVASTQAGPLMTGLRAVSQSADQTLKQATSTLVTTGNAFAGGGDGGDLAGTLNELRQAARSLHALADYLDAHPGSLLRGKSLDGE